MSNEETTVARQHPATEMMGHGYRPDWSEKSLKPPIFQTSTFVFDSAQEGKEFFELAYGLREPAADEQIGLIYSRINNPGIEILEARLCRWEQAERGLSFASGMAAITTTMLAHLRPGDTLLYSEPLYGGTDHLVRSILPEFGIDTIGITGAMSEDEVVALAGDADVRMIYLETPANPTNALFNIEGARRIADRCEGATRRPLLVVDNTFLGPIWQNTLRHGADISIYSATKHLGGHSDLIAGAVVGSDMALKPIAAMRTFTGTMLDPWTAWLLCRSLETLDLRMRQATTNAQQIALWLTKRSEISRVAYLGLLEEGTPDHTVYTHQCSGPGSMIAIDLGTESAAFAFIDALQRIQLAVSLGGTESLVEHPASMTHAGVDLEVKQRHGVTEGLVRLSIGVERVEDLLADISQALDRIVLT